MGRVHQWMYPVLILKGTMFRIVELDHSKPKKMKMKTFFGSIIMASFIIFPGQLFLFSNLNSGNTPLDQIRIQYLEDLKNFESSCAILTDFANSYQHDELTIHTLRTQLKMTRLAYKQTEFLTAYFQPQAVNNYINGAPLPKIDPVIPALEIIPPNGLQTLDELIFSDKPGESRSEIYNLAKKLSNDVKVPIQFLKNKPFQHRYIMEAVRSELIRIYTLGLTGFDTPGSVQAIPEAQSSLYGMIQALKLYEELALSRGIQKQYQALISGLIGYKTYLAENPDFDSLDRMFILRNFMNPLYKQIYDFQRALNIEFREEVDPTMSSINYHAESIFSDDFLNPPFFAEIASSDLYDEKKIELGKRLFFDPALSKDLNKSCASCHHTDKAFTDGKPKSVDVETRLTRNAPTLVNAVYSPKYFLDLREYDLERQVKHVIYDKHEFNMDFVELADRLKESEEYLKLFKEAYGDRDRYDISTWSISNSLAAYVASLRSWNSDFDQYARAEIDTIDHHVINGYNLFMGKAACGTCHFAPSFNGTVPPAYREAESEVLGVLVEYDTVNPVLDPDPGRMANGRARDQAPHYLGSFKTVTVRNVELTGPYMHNGGFSTLEDVMDFYNRGGGAGMGLEVPHQTLPDAALNLSKNEISDIIAFMKALTDTSGMTDVPERLPEFESHPEWSDRYKIY